jgi:uncharacterized small protein (DUF1192 family)
MNSKNITPEEAIIRLSALDENFANTLTDGQKGVLYDLLTDMRESFISPLSLSKEPTPEQIELEAKKFKQLLDAWTKEGEERFHNHLTILGWREAREYSYKELTALKERIEQLEKEKANKGNTRRAELLDVIDEREGEIMALKDILKYYQETPTETANHLRIENAELLNAVEQLTARIAELEQGNRWISVEERLPEDRTRIVLAYHTTYKAVRENQFRDGMWVNGVNGINTDVTHWMDLPAPPIRDKKEQNK